MAAVVAGDYSAYEDWQSNVQKSNDARKMVLTYECGARHSDEDLGPEIAHSKLAEIPESQYRSPDVDRARLAHRLTNGSSAKLSPNTN